MLPQGSHSTNPKICSKVSGREPSDAPVDRGGASLEVPKGANRRLRFDCAAAMAVNNMSLVASSLVACCIIPGGLPRQAWRAVASGLVACCAKRAGLLHRARWAALIIAAYAADTFGMATGHGLTIKGDAQIYRNPSVSGGAYRHVSAIWYHTWAVRTLRAWRNW